METQRLLEGFGKYALSIVVPAHNEEENIPGLFSDLDAVVRLILLPTQAVIVSDHSKDRTYTLAKKLARKRSWSTVIENDGLAGMGNAIKKGVQSSNSEYFAVIMADRVCDVMALPSMLEMARTQDLDIVIGSRFMQRSILAFRASFRYHISSIIFRLMSKPIFRKITDPTYAFRLVRRDFWESCPPRAGDFSISPENTLLGVLRRARIAEYPTRHGVRELGQSSFRFSKMGISYARLILWGLANRRRFLAQPWRSGHSSRIIMN